MQVMIIDASGSVSDEQVNTAVQYACSILNGGKINVRHEVICNVYWTGMDRRTGRRIYLEHLVESFRGFDHKCTIHFITDGLVLLNEIRGVDYLHVHEDCIYTTPDYIKLALTSVVPARYMLGDDNA